MMQQNQQNQQHQMQQPQMQQMQQPQMQQMQQPQMQQPQMQQPQMQQQQQHQQIPSYQMTPVAKADEMIRLRIKNAELNGLTQSKFLGFMVLLLTIIVCFQSYLNYIPIVWYTIFLVYVVLLLICIFYY